MENLDAVVRVLTTWELPLAPSHYQAAARSISQCSDFAEFSPEDTALLLASRTAEWAANGTAAPELISAFDTALHFVPDVIDSLSGRTYVQLHGRLMKGTSDTAGLSHVTARRLLSRTALIAHLLREEYFSCTQVARVIGFTEESLQVPYGSIQVIARSLGVLPRIDLEASTLWGKDQSLSSLLFPDSSPLESIDAAAESITEWMPELDARTLLISLSGEGKTPEPFWPYLQMLHWCLTPIEFYDHPVSFLYEFSPRGQTAVSIFENYPAVTGNPFLNNAKAVQTLDYAWARHRGGENAHALVSLLSSTDSLPLRPRQEIARILRAWVCRVIELRSVPEVAIDIDYSDDTLAGISEAVAREQTQTQGVIEQRVVDLLATLAYHKEGWREKGIGDGVNVSNFSQHKLGDIEFVNVDERTAVALEAHGGHLTNLYVAEHIRSLSRVIEQRLRESWAALDEAEAWKITVKFIAHSHADNLPLRRSIHGVNVTFDYLDYSSLLSLAFTESTPADREQKFNRILLDELNSPKVRQSARDKFLQICETL